MRKPTRLDIYKNPTLVLEDLQKWFFKERAKFINIKKKEPLPVFIRTATDRVMNGNNDYSDRIKLKLYNSWKRAKVTATKHPDIATLTFKKVSEDIIDSFNKIEKPEDIHQRFGKSWDKIKNDHYFTPYREYEEVFRELLELGCDESLLDYEGREIDREWIDLAREIVTGLLASGVIPGKDKHIFLRIPKLEPIFVEDIEGIEESDKAGIKRIFEDSKLFPEPKDYKHFRDKYEKNDLFNKRYLKYKEVYTYVKEILYKVAETNLDVCYALKKIKEKLNELSSNPDSDEDLRNLLKDLNLEFKDLDIELERLPLYEISIPQVNETKDIDILIKTLREYIRAVDLMFDMQRGKFNKDPLYAQCFDHLNKIRIVPLIENPALMMKMSSFICEFFDRLEKLREDIVKEFKERHRQDPIAENKANKIFTNFTVVDFGENPHSLLRIWLARSDTALNYGNIAAEIARVFALSECEEAKKILREKPKDPPDIQLLYGVGLPPFRGGLNPSDKTIWKHYPVDVTMQGIKFDMDAITVRQFVKNNKLFSFQPFFKEEFFEDETGGVRYNLEDLFSSGGELVTNWEQFVKPVEEWHSKFKLDEKDSVVLKRIMAESICIYWQNISRMGTLIRYLDEVSPKLRSRLKTTVFSRENPEIDIELFNGVELNVHQPANEKLDEAMKKLNNEWPPHAEPLRLSRAIKLNSFLTNCGIPPTLLDLSVFEKIKENDKKLLKRYVPGLGHLIKNDYKLFVPDAAAILLDRIFVNEIEENTKNALIDLGMDPNFWTEAESNFKDVLLGDVIEYNALLLIAITTYKFKVPVRRGKRDNYDFFIDKLSQMQLDQIARQLVVESQLESFSKSYPENIHEALKNIGFKLGDLDTFKGDQRWIKVIITGAKIALLRGWVG